MRPRTVIIADDNEEMRGALVALIETETTLQLVGLATNASEAAFLADEHHPDVALVDVRMQGGGVRAARDIKACSPGTKVVALSAYADEEHVMGMRHAGASQYILKGSPITTILSALTGD